MTLAQATSAAGIIFQSQNYTLADGGNTFTLTNPSASFTTPDISIAPGVAGVLSASFTKSVAAGFVSGGGTLTLSGSDSFASSLSVDNATLQVVSGASVLVKSGSLLLGANAANSNYFQSGGSFGSTTAYIGDGSLGTSSFSMNGGVCSVSSSFNLAYKANGTMNISGGSLFVGGAFATGLAAADSATINLTGGTTTLNAANDLFSATTGASTAINISGSAVTNMTSTNILGSANGTAAVLNLSGGTINVNGGNFCMARNGFTAAGVVNQTSGLFNVTNTGTQILDGWDFLTANAGFTYGAYILSGGSLKDSGIFSVGHEGYTMGMFSQTGGTATFTSGLYTAFDAYTGGTGLIDLSGGRTIHTTGGTVMNIGTSPPAAGRAPSAFLPCATTAISRISQVISSLSTPTM